MVSFQLLLTLSSLHVTVTSAWTTTTHRQQQYRATPRMALPSTTTTTTTTPLVKSRQPHKLDNGRGTFLGFREAKDVKNKPLQSSPSALMPDGGLSPCVIRVLGVGGGGCNAVRLVELVLPCCSVHDSHYHYSSTFILYYHRLIACWKLS